METRIFISITKTDDEKVERIVSAAFSDFHQANLFLLSEV